MSVPFRSADPFQFPGKNQREPFELLHFDAITPRLDAHDFVQGLLVDRSAVVIYGASGSGKTFFTTDLCLHIAAGMTWQGRRVEQRGVIYCVLEGTVGFANRVAAWRERYAPSGSVNFAAIESPINMLDAEADVEALCNSLDDAKQLFGMPVGLVVLDTLSRAMAGGDENNPEAMGTLVRNIDYLRDRTGAAVASVHHTGKDASRGARGHSLLRAAIDTEIEVAFDEDMNVRTATVVKQREMSKSAAITFGLEVIELGENRHGEVVTTCIVTDGASTPAPRRKAKPVRNPAAARAYEILEELVRDKGERGVADITTAVATVPMAAWFKAYSANPLPGSNPKTMGTSFKRSMEILLQSKHVAMVGDRVWPVSQ